MYTGFSGRENYFCMETRDIEMMIFHGEEDIELSWSGEQFF